MKKMMREAIKEALSEEMIKDERVFLIGEDIGHYGGTLQITAGLFKIFGGARVIDTPISESAITGAAIGAAMMGMRPVLELMFSDFLPLAADQLINNAAKMCYSYNGQMQVPMVIRAPFGAGTRSGMHHSQNLESCFANIPGLKIVMPSNAYDSKGLLKAAIRDNNPVIYFEHKMLYGTRCDVSEDDFIVPIGKADIKRAGKDITIVAWGAMVPKALNAAISLEREGIEAEVVDLRSLKPIDEETIVKSVIKTSRLLIVQEACLHGGLAGEVAAIAAKSAFEYLDAPIERIGAPDTPVPFSPTLEDAFIPNEVKIVETTKKMFGIS